MKRILLGLINLYQRIPGRFHLYCKYYPTCSDYSKEAISTYGIFKGGCLSIFRILRCNPFSKGGYDPVPRLERGKLSMKKKFILLIVVCLSLCGCFKRDNMEDIVIYTTIYPINYITTYLYGNNAKINSIYPNGVDVTTYLLTSKQIADYSSNDLFVFNSLDRDRDYAVKMINQNSNLKIIDVALGMEINNSIEELWLNPYNYLMMAQNLKNGLNEYISNPYLIKEVDDNYESLKLKLSSLDAKIKTAVKSSSYDTIVVDNHVFKFLEKYDLKVISLEEDENLTQKTIEDVRRLINNGSIKYIYTKDNDTNDTVKKLLDSKKATLVKVNDMFSVDGGVTNSNENYLTIMNDNIDLLKKELYK